MSCPDLTKAGKEPSKLENGPNVTSERQLQDDSPKWIKGGGSGVPDPTKQNSGLAQTQTEEAAWSRSTGGVIRVTTE
ncbi:hypothetical protein VULLAG_LOCUS17707 [Vulpes lagopus]